MLSALAQDGEDNTGVWFGGLGPFFNIEPTGADSDECHLFSILQGWSILGTD